MFLSQQLLFFLSNLIMRKICINIDLYKNRCVIPLILSLRRCFLVKSVRYPLLKVEMQTMLLLNAKWDFFSNINIKQTRKKGNQKETECIYEIIWKKNWSCFYTICGFIVSNWTFVHKNTGTLSNPQGELTMNIIN